MVGIEAVATQLLNGLVYGSVLALISIGLTIIFGLLGIINFAHGAFYALGAYVGVVVIGALGTPYAFILAILTVPILVGVVGVGLELSIIRPLYDREGLLAPLLLTFGLMLVIHGVIKFFAPNIETNFNLIGVLAGSVNLGFTTYPTYRLFVVLMMFLIAGLVWIFLNHTDIGVVIRAATENRTMVKVLGIDINRIYTLVFALGTGLAALAGLLHGPMVNVYPEMGIDILIVSFVVVVVGGLNSFKGSIIAGILIGVISNMTYLFWPFMTNIIIFVFMGVFLLFRPHGLFGQEMGGIE